MLGLLPLAIPAASPLLAEQRSKMEQPQRVAGLSERREDKPALARMPSATEDDAAKERTQENWEGTMDGQRNSTSGNDQQNTGRLRSDDDKDQSARHN
jgi:hypothetical protein